MQANVEKFKTIKNGFDQLGFDKRDLQSIFFILAAIINVGELEFVHKESKDNIDRFGVKNSEQVEIGE